MIMNSGMTGGTKRRRDVHISMSNFNGNSVLGSFQEHISTNPLIRPVIQWLCVTKLLLYWLNFPGKTFIASDVKGIWDFNLYNLTDTLKSGHSPSKHMSGTSPCSIPINVSSAGVKLDDCIANDLKMHLKCDDYDYELIEVVHPYVLFTKPVSMSSNVLNRKKKCAHGALAPCFRTCTTTDIALSSASNQHSRQNIVTDFPRASIM